MELAELLELLKQYNVVRYKDRERELELIPDCGMQSADDDDKFELDLSALQVMGNQSDSN